MANVPTALRDRALLLKACPPRITRSLLECDRLTLERLSRLNWQLIAVVAGMTSQ
jgi:hypothetical protein